MGDVRAVLCGYYGQGNGGDEALLASLLQMLPSHIHPVVLSGNPPQTYQRYGVESCDRKSAFQLLEVLKTSDYFIWGGGSLMQDVTSWVSPIYYGGLMGLAQQRGLKTIAWAQGIGPLKRPFTRWLTKEVLLGCVGVSVRDRASAQRVTQWQIDPLLAPDPVWALQAETVPSVQESQSPKIAVILRPHPHLTPQRLNALTQALIGLQTATESSILLIPFQPVQDLALAEQIASQLPGFHQIITLEDPRQLKGVFQGVDLVIGMRLHGLIMAASEGCRCFALSYDPKVTQLMEAINIPGWELTAIPEESKEILHQWLDYFNSGKALDSIQIQSLCDRALLHRDLLHQIMG